MLESKMGGKHFCDVFQEINKNAQELISEEEKEKRRAEKRRAKKKVHVVKKNYVESMINDCFGNQMEHLEYHVCES